MKRTLIASIASVATVITCTATTLISGSRAESSMASCAHANPGDQHEYTGKCSLCACPRYRAVVAGTGCYCGHSLAAH